MCAYVMTYELGWTKSTKQDTLGLTVRLISKGLFVVNQTRMDSFIKSAMMETERGNKLWLEKFPKTRDKCPLEKSASSPSSKKKAVPKLKATRTSSLRQGQHAFHASFLFRED